MSPTITVDNLMGCIQEKPRPNIGQFDKGAIKELNKMVKRGEVVKWKSSWVTGSPIGPGAQKTWYGLRSQIESGEWQPGIDYLRILAMLVPFKPTSVDAG